MAVEIFNKSQFEAALKFYDFVCLGERQGNIAYRIDFGNPDAFVMIYSSIAPDGVSRGDGEDSIRAWLVTKDNAPIGGKTQRWVTRKPGWQGRLVKMIEAVISLGRWIQPCPRCGKILRLVVKDDKAFIFCPEDKPGVANRHNPLIVLDKDTGEQQSMTQAEHGNCPVCKKPLSKVTIRQGKNAGKQALTCSAKDERGNYLNHLFQVI